MKVGKHLKRSVWLVLGAGLVLTVFLLKPVLPPLDNSMVSSQAPSLSAEESTADKLTENPVALRELAQQKNVRVGAAVLMDLFKDDADYRSLLAREFNSLTPENAMKFARLQPKPGRYRFSDADDLMDFAKAHQMQVHGHVLVWHRNLPNWLTDKTWSRQALKQILKRHIFTVVGRYRGQVAAWDVVNEAVERQGQLRESIWSKTIGPDYIELAFRWAHEADPGAKLFYNDYRGEGLGRKSDAIYALAQELLQRDVPISGVGLQMHTSIQDAPKPEKIAANIRRLNDLGLSVRITEMDVQIYGDERPEAERLQAQAAVYQDTMAVCLAATDCTGLTTWGISDRHSWIPAFFDRPDAPLLFDEDYQRKPAYDALIDALDP
ncbi:MAG: endo-1,4-beta-xylanase [Cyanophyceae cyanobacterium]